MWAGATEIVEGDCRGADRLAAQAARELGLVVHTMPADWERLGNAAGPARNVEMLRRHPDSKLVLAFHDDLNSSSGTKHMVFEVCLPAGKEVVLVSRWTSHPTIPRTYPGRTLHFADAGLGRLKMWLTVNQTSLSL